MLHIGAGRVSLQMCIRDRNRPSLALHGDVAAACEESLGAPSTWRALVSISHDGECAIAQVAIVDASV